MAALIRVVEQFAVLLYAACLIGVIWSVRTILAAMRERRDTLYSLEREAAGARIGRGVMSALAFVALGAAIVVVAQVVAPALPPADAPTPTPAGPVLTLTPSVTPFPTPTPESSPTPEASPGASQTTAEPGTPPTPGPTAPPVQIASCPDPNVVITAPGNGAVLSGPFQVFGTASIENFSFYKFVLNGPATNFRDQTAGDVYKTPVDNGYLGTLEEPLIAVLLQSPGAYRFSLVAVNNEGNEAPHCEITLQLIPPAASPD